ncbi:hypothetical protein IQ216_13875 [Cyanobium sp. LEGE 06143]|uniref:hypothetical protein n=1 Tax=Cyanobium sp. LEGE 06143 TaxID=945727 RepID=UPI00188086DC|nr:hypothetical protein [Cyanobium sp. LEGE 06143]MBE9174116.1 hypothetical protein [Cyanobium sp. LEGE 06143]
MGWDRYRAVVFENEKWLGLFPAEVELSRLASGVPRWESLSADVNRLARRRMKAYEASWSTPTTASAGSSSASVNATTP